MQVDRNSWHYRVYVWQRSQMDNDVKSHINLCPYVRIVLIWAPMLWLIFAGKIIPRVYNFFLWVTVGAAIGLYEFHKRLPGEFITFLIVLTCISALSGIMFAVSYYMEHGGKRIISSLVPVRLVTEYAEAAHSKICPLIEVI